MKVKICGITSSEDATFAAREGVDAIGLNFYSGSPRSIKPELASEIVRALPTFVEPVGLFVNATAQEIRTVAGQVGLHTVQLHGDEPPELLVDLAEFRLIRAFRLGNQGMETISNGIEACRRAGRIPEGVLIDAHEKGRFGGTGKTPPWRVLAEGYDRKIWPPLVLAGGLTPENVAEAIEQVRPWVVDVASGVEGTTPGRKCSERVSAFLAEAREAFRRVWLRDHT